MQTTQATRSIAAPASKLWPLISDVTQIARWHPSISHVDLLSDSPSGMGQRGAATFTTAPACARRLLNLR